MEADAVGGDPPADEGRATGAAAPRKGRGAPVAPGRFEGDFAIGWRGRDSYSFAPDGLKPFAFTASDGFVVRPGAMLVRGRDTIRAAWPPIDLWKMLPAVVVYDWLYLSSRAASPEVDAHRACDIFLEAARTVAAECRLPIVEQFYRRVRRAATTANVAYLWEAGRWAPEAIAAALPSG